ncbi:MAG: NADH:flavin oxidoreductase [Coxiellaceae bacterium]|nr:NADH:flavin oxidoreductase [Coxiellaceae bacterium]
MLKESLLKPFNLGSLQLKNRIVMAPMTRSMSKGHIPSQASADYYARRAAGGVGLIITEGTAIDHPGSHGYPNVPNFFGEEALAGWKNVVKQVHAAGGIIAPQLWHVGSARQAKKIDESTPDNYTYCCACDHHDVPGVGPSEILHPNYKEGEVPCALSQEEINKIIHAYAQGAADAKRIGFDAIELHGAHGYLIDQFFWQKTNHRDDKYGGDSLAKRAQFAVEIVEAVREATGPDFPIIFRFSQWKMGAYNEKMAQTPEELEAFIDRLVSAGVDIFHCSTRRFNEPEFDGSALNLAGWVKKISGKATITVGSVGLDIDFISSFKGIESKAQDNTMGDLDQRLSNEEFDLVAVGRMLLTNPNWPELIQQDQLDQAVPFDKSALKTLV